MEVPVKINQADQIEDKVKTSMEALHNVHEKRKALLAEVNEKIFEQLELKQQEFQQILQEYFILKNKRLEAVVNEVQNNLKGAYEVHTKISSIRDQVIQAVNRATKPTLPNNDEGDLLCSGYGEGDFKKIFSNTEEAFGRLNTIQEQYDGIVSEVLDTVPHVMSSKLQELEIAVLERNKQTQQWAEMQRQKIMDNVDKIRQVIETMETVKGRMESIFQAVN